MLNIPDAIKALYLADKQAGVRRNFRVTFPNGELPDINADQILTESVKLDESIMSQSTFRFGLAEAPQISFETIGVPNMMGMTIKCFHEIEITGLSVADLAAVQADPGDGEVVLAADSDLGYGFYRVPMGVFMVDKCPRNHGAMMRRRVTAFGIDSASSPNGTAYRFEKWRNSLFYSVNTYTVDLSKWIFSVLGIEMLSGAVTPDVVSGSAGSAQLATYYYYDTLGLNRAQVRLIIDTASVYDYTHDLVAQVNLPEIVRADAALESFETAWAQSGADSVPGAADAKAELLDVFSRLVSWADDIGYAPYTKITAFPMGLFRGVGSGRDASGLSAYYPITEDTAKGIFYLPIIGNNTSNRSITVPVSFKIEVLTLGGAVVTSETYDLLNGSPTFTRYTFSPAGAQYTISATGTRDTETADKYTFDGALPMVDIVNGALELAGIFGRAARNGAYKRAVLDDSNPYEMPRSQYSELWFDEYDVSDIGIIYYTYTNADGQQALSMTLEDGGGSIYDLSGNWILQNIPTTQTDAEDMITTYFVPNIGGVDFTPIELSAKGLPWLEAGDAVAVMTEDGETVASYILERTLTGIQSLRDEITSTGGELISADTAGYGS